MAFKMKAGKEGPMKKNFGSALNFNAGLRAASKAGKLDNNPKFKAAVDGAPMKKDKEAMLDAKPKAPGKDKFIGPRNKIVGEGYHKEKKGKMLAEKSKVKKTPTTVGANIPQMEVKKAGCPKGRTKSIRAPNSAHHSAEPLTQLDCMWKLPPTRQSLERK